MKKRLYILVTAVTLGLGFPSCFDLTEEVFNQVGSDIYYTDEASVKGVVASAYGVSAHSFVEWFMYLSEFPADQIAWRSWNGGGWGWDNAEKFVLSVQSWNADAVIIRNAWRNTWTPIAQCNRILDDLQRIPPESLGMTQAQTNGYIAEIRMLRAWAYYYLFETWGGSIPIFTGTSSDVSLLPPSASADGDFQSGTKKVFDFIMQELDETLNDLPRNRNERMNQAMNRVLKARMLLNAELFIGEDRFNECATLCEAIIKGDFGTYSLAPDYRTNFSMGNQNSPEIIFAFATAQPQLNLGWMRNLPFLPYNYANFIGGSHTGAGSWNCVILAPSYDNSGNVYIHGGTDNPVCFLDAPYNDKLGAPYERFHDKDVRKQNFRWEDGNYTGMFLKGYMEHRTIADSLLPSDADRVNQPWFFVDQVGTFQNINRNLETVMNPRWGETNSGIRLFKYPMAPSSFDWRNIYEVEFRLAEVIYMLAECRMRAGNAGAAKELINNVRKRYFSAADWAAIQDVPGKPFTTFDMDWLLSEWGLEFLNEGRRRRTDLRRFDKFTQGQWWFFGRATEPGYDLSVKRDRKYEWYPLPTEALTVNPNLIQNPAYQ
jgi:hypothetical protein